MSNPRYNRVEQVDESGLGFLQKKANDAEAGDQDSQRENYRFRRATTRRNRVRVYARLRRRRGAKGGKCYRLAGAHFVSQIMDTAQKAKILAMSAETANIKSGEWATVGGAGGGDGGSIEGGDSEGDKVNYDTDGEEAEDGGDGGGERAGEGLSSGWDTVDGPETLKAKSLMPG